MSNELIVQFTSALAQQTELLKKVFEKRFDALENQIFQMAQDMDKYKAENDGLRRELSLANNKIDNLAKFSAAAQINITKLQQDEIKNEVVVISDTNNFAIPVAKEKLACDPRRGSGKGKFFAVLKFIELKEKILFLKEKKKFSKLRVFSSLCKERQKIFTTTRKLQAEGKINRTWTYRDEVFIENSDGQKTRIDSCFQLHSLFGVVSQ